MTTRRSLVLGAALLGGLGASGCSEQTPAPPAPTPSPDPSTTPSATPTRVPGSPTLPRGLAESQRTAYSYGDDPHQVSDLWLPADGHRDALVVLVHGGGWFKDADRSDFDADIADLVGDGWPVLNVDYRGVGGGGGWTGTFTDVATAVDQAVRAAAEHGLPLERSVIVGHSAGGQLATWAAARRRLPAGAPGAGPLFTPAGAASMSGVVHPTALGYPDTGDPAVTALFGGTPGEVDDRYAIGDPARLVPLGMPLFVVHGSADDTVPPWQSQQFADAARAAGDTVQLEIVDGAGHGEPLDPSSRMWQLTRTWIGGLLG